MACDCLKYAVCVAPVQLPAYACREVKAVHACRFIGVTLAITAASILLHTNSAALHGVHIHHTLAIDNGSQALTVLLCRCWLVCGYEFRLSHWYPLFLLL